MRTSKKNVPKRLLLAVLCMMVIASAVACGAGASYVCDNCQETFSGNAYYDMSYQSVMCEDCARSYWMPLDYKEFRWEPKDIPDSAKAANR